MSSERRLEAWIKSLQGEASTFDISEAEFWISAFVAGVKKRASELATANSHGVPHDPNFVDYSDAFTELANELLGGKLLGD